VPLRKHERSLRYDSQLDAWISDTGPGITGHRKADEDRIRALGDSFSVGLILGSACSGVLFSLLMFVGFML
jgi:uncharacterized oligopeptide transporter (OPT) family protein